MFRSLLTWFFMLCPHPHRWQSWFARDRYGSILPVRVCLRCGAMEPANPEDN